MCSMDGTAVMCGVCFEPVELPLRAGDVVTVKGPAHRECATGLLGNEGVSGVGTNGEGEFFSAMEEDKSEDAGMVNNFQLFKIESAEMDPVKMLTNAIGRKKDMKVKKVVSVGRWTMLFRFQILNTLIERIEDAGKEDESMTKVDKFLNELVWSRFLLSNRLPDGWPPTTCAPIRRIGTDMTMEGVAVNRADGRTDERSMKVARVKTLLFMMAWDAAWRVMSFVLQPASLALIDGFGTGWASHAAAQTNNLENNDLQVVVLPRSFRLNEEHGEGDDSGDNMDTDEGAGGGGDVETPPKKKLKEAR